MVAISGFALAFKYYYNKKKTPLCHSDSDKFDSNCSVCGEDDVEVCKVEDQ